MKAIIFLCLCFVNQAWTAVIALEDIDSLDLVVSEEREVCFWSSLEHGAPCSPGSRSGVQKIAEAFLILKDGTRLSLGKSTPGKVGHREHVDFKKPLGNLKSELKNLIENQAVYFNQYNLCYRLGVESESLTSDERASGTYFHLTTSRLYVDCDSSSIPPMVFVKD